MQDRTLQLWDRRIKALNGGQIIQSLSCAGTAVSWARDQEHLLAVGEGRKDDDSTRVFLSKNKRLTCFRNHVVVMYRAG